MLHIQISHIPTNIWILGPNLLKKGISSNGAQIQIIFGQGYHVQNVTFTGFFWIVG